jgi:hypothetical protein
MQFCHLDDTVNFDRALQTLTVAPLILKWSLLRAYFSVSEVRNSKSVGVDLSGDVGGQTPGLLQ